MSAPIFSVFSVNDMQLIEHKQHSNENKKRRNHVKSACVPCRDAHTACDEKRPCTRCIKRCHPEACISRNQEDNYQVSSGSSGSSGSSSGGGEQIVSLSLDKEVEYQPKKRQKTTHQVPLVVSSDNMTNNTNDVLLSPLISLNSTLNTTTLPLDNNNNNRATIQEKSTPTTTKDTKIFSTFDNVIQDNPKTTSVGSSNENNLLFSLINSTSNILNLCKTITQRFDSLQTEIQQIKLDLGIIQRNQQQLGYSLGVIQKQMLFLLHCPAFPLESGDPAIAFWDFETHKLRDFNNKFSELVEFNIEYLQSNFYLINLVPEFFLPFAYDFLHEMSQNMHMGKDPKVAQMMYIQTGSGKELFVHVSSQPQYGTSEEPENFITSIRKVTFQV